MKFKTFPALVLLLLTPATVLTQDSLWKTYIDAGTKAYEEGQYSEAERRFNLARREAESFGPEDPRLALSYYNLALVYLKQEGKLPEAIKNSRQALAIWERVVWEKKPRAESLAAANNQQALASALLNPGAYDLVEQLLKQALAIKHYFLRPENPTIAVTLGYLAITNFIQKNYTEANIHLKQALAIFEEAGDTASDRDIITTLGYAATINQFQKNYAEAESFLQRALAFREKSREPEYFDSDILKALADLYVVQHKYKEAEAALLRRLKIIETAYGLNGSHTALAVDDLASAYMGNNQYAKAESLYKEALAKLEAAPGDVRSTRLKILTSLVNLYESLKEYASTELLLQECLRIIKELDGLEYPRFANYLNFQGSLFLDQAKYAEAESVFEQALAIREKVLPPESPDIATSLNNLAKVYYYLDKYERAEPLYQRAISISQKFKDKSPADLAWYTKNYALLLYAQGKSAQAESLFRNAIDMFPQSQKDSSEAYSLYELAELYRHQKKYKESEASYKKALILMDKIPEQDQHQLATTLQKYASLLRQMNREAEAVPLEERAKNIKSKYARTP
ncbi:MAG: hypothetical protein QOH25_1782 [Acidobacteriota bacterium]|jgi:tetratricopeptide (TPR) repeat protein|nr:hypothetical protein [Acidobacteriota bacterium]